MLRGSLFDRLVAMTTRSVSIANKKILLLSR